MIRSQVFFSGVTLIVDRRKLYDSTDIGDRRMKNALKEKRST